MSGQEHRRDIVFIEITAHELRVLDRDTESKSLHVINVRHIFQQCRHNKISTTVSHRATEGINLGKLALIIATSTPFKRVQIHGIGDTEILERAQKFAFNSFWQADLRRNTIVKVRQHTLAVHAFRSGGQPQQNAGLIVRQQLLIGRRCSMVEFVHDDVIVELRCSFCCEILRIESLDRDKQIVDTFRLVAAYKHFAKVGIFENGPERVHALLEDFFSVSNKEQSAGLIRILLAEALIIQR